MTFSNFDRYERIAWAYDFLDLPFEYGRYRKIRPQIFRGLSGQFWKQVWARAETSRSTHLAPKLSGLI